MVTRRSAQRLPLAGRSTPVGTKTWPLCRGFEAREVRGRRLQPRNPVAPALGTRLAALQVTENGAFRLVEAK